MVIEDINLTNAAKRVAQIVKDNLLLVGISTVGVRTVTGLIGFLLGTWQGLCWVLVLVMALLRFWEVGQSV